LLLAPVPVVVVITLGRDVGNEFSEESNLNQLVESNELKTGQAVFVVECLRWGTVREATLCC
jgi:hypothetical protein